MARQRGGVEAAEQLLSKERVPGELGHDANGQAVAIIRASGRVEQKQVAALQVGGHARVQSLENFGRERLVDLAPRHPLGAFGTGALHHKLVAGRAASALASARHQCAR